MNRDDEAVPMWVAVVTVALFAFLVVVSVLDSREQRRPPAVTAETK
jgi:hypothetical protein